ncbi:MAG: VWA domain-containing protein [Chloroflexota bacterium]
MTFSFQSPNLLFLLLAIPIIATLPYWLSWLSPQQAKRWQSVATMRYASTQMARSRSHTKPTRSWRLILRPLPSILRWLALACLIVALARPQLVDAQQIIKGEGVDIVLALDISGSMESLDFEPDNRLQAAKKVIEAFIEQRPYDRIGLTVFASEAFAQSPLTLDHAVLNRLLGQVELATVLGIEDGTAIGMGLATAVNMLKQTSADSKIVVLLTDGVNNSGQIDPLTAGEAAKALGIRVYTIGAGRPGQVPMPQNTLFGQRIVMVESVLDEETLQQIADMTGGLFFRAEDTAGLQQVYDEINELEKSEIEVRTFSRYEELAWWLLLPAFGLMVVEMTLRRTVLRTLP